MIDLTNIDEVKKLDPKDVYGSTGMLADQCQQVFDEYFHTNFYSEAYKSAKNIVIAGMGGSAYGGHVVNALYKDSLKLPLTVTSDYTLPEFVNNETLVMLASYSGTTEEVLACAEDAKRRGAKITGYTSGGTDGKAGPLGDLLEKNYPGFIFNSRFNPSGQPRLGTGYMIMSTISLLRSLEVISVSNDEVKEAIQELRDNKNEIMQHGQDIAQKLIGYIPVIMTAEFLNGNAHIMRNQFNETAKSFAAYAAVPELNHHLLEGLKNPEGHKLQAILIHSNLYSEKNAKRLSLTKDVIGQNNVPVIEYQAKGSSRLSQMLNILSLGGYVTVYLALLYGLDPSLIPWVDYFKEKLKQ